MNKQTEALKMAIEALSIVSSVYETARGVRVTTHCMYPSNGLVTLLVSGGEGTFVVSDDGGAIRELTATGVNIRQASKSISNFASLLGVEYRDGVLYSPLSSAKELPAALLLVANSSKELALHLYDYTKVNKKSKKIECARCGNKFGHWGKDDEQTN